jgi:hypothetical protein
VPVGDSSRQVFSKSALSFGHPRKEVMQRCDGMATLAARASPITIKVASAPKQFEDLTLTKAIYGTGWDRDVLLVANSNGVIKLVIE